MEVKHRLLEFNNTSRYNLLKLELDRIGADYQINNLGSLPSWEARSIEFIIAENDPRYPHIENLIKTHGFRIQTGVYYNQKEINEAEWLYATVGEFQYPQPEDDYVEATYDISNYCPKCGIGKKQNKPFRLKFDFRQKRALFLGLHWVFDEIFVRSEVKSVFEKEGITGINFSHPVYHRTNEDIQTVFQLAITTIIEPELITDGLVTESCQTCSRVKYNYPRRDEIIFNREGLTHISNIAKSYEYFGSGGNAHRLILVSRNFADLVIKYKLRGLNFTPIKLV